MQSVPKLTTRLGAQDVPPGAPAPTPEQEIEQLLLNKIVVSDGDLEALAAERAKAVRAYLLQSGKVEAERLFITESQPGGVKTNGSKVFLQLQ